MCNVGVLVLAVHHLAQMSVTFLVVFVVLLPSDNQGIHVEHLFNLLLAIKRFMWPHSQVPTNMPCSYGMCKCATQAC